MSNWRLDTPTDGDPIRFADDELRNFKQYIEEFLSQSGHVFPGTYGSTAGTHIPGEVEVVGFTEDIDNEDIEERTIWFETTTSRLFSKISGEKTKIGGVSSLPKGTRAVFVQDVAPTGWSIVTTLNDGVAYVSNTGGVEKAGGSWTITGFSVPEHSHSYTIPNHQHATPFIQESYALKFSGYPFGSGSTLSFNVYTGGRGAGPSGVRVLTSHPYNPGTYTTSTSTFSIDHDGSWRPAYVAGIVCEKE